MKISLRRANALQAQILETINGMSLSTTVSLSEFTPATDQLGVAAVNFSKALEQRKALRGAYYYIRLAVGKANDSVGIDDRLTELAEIDKNLADLAIATASVPVKSFQVIEGELKKHSEKSSQNQYYGSAEYTSAFMSEHALSLLKEEAAQLRKRKIALNDEILSLNIKTEITLVDVAVSLLKWYNLI